jgi:hypothetical protein
VYDVGVMRRLAAANAPQEEPANLTERHNADRRFKVDPEKFACQLPNPGAAQPAEKDEGGPAEGPPYAINKRLSDFLSKLSAAHKETQITVMDNWRVYNYKKASQKVRDFHLPLDRGNEANMVEVRLAKRERSSIPGWGFDDDI